jgi:hypothetical protein
MKGILRTISSKALVDPSAITKKLLLIGAAAVALLFAGCAGDYYVSGPYEGPYYGGFGPYYSGYGPYYENNLVVGGYNYSNHYGWHHFYGRSFGARHFVVIHNSGGFHGGGFHGGGFHR